MVDYKVRYCFANRQSLTRMISANSQEDALEKATSEYTVVFKDGMGELHKFSLENVLYTTVEASNSGRRTVRQIPAGL